MSAVSFHATLITGGSAEGRREKALEIAAAMLCGKGESRGCGTCAHCRKVSLSVHPDLTVIQPDKGVIKVETARQIRSQAYVRPNEAEMRVFVVLEADCMNENAQNALLKVLEEPPGYAAFLLTAAVGEKLRATVRSRCGLIRLEQPQPQPPSAECMKYLQTLVSRDRLELGIFCRTLEKLDRESMTVFLSGAEQLLQRVLRVKAGCPAAEKFESDAAAVLSAKGLAQMQRRLGELAEMQLLNTSSGHIAGLVNVYSYETLLK